MSSSSSSSSSSSPFISRRFLVFGGTGRTGIPFVKQALEKGHQVDIYVRNANKVPKELITLGGNKLTITQG